MAVTFTDQQFQTLLAQMAQMGQQQGTEQHAPPVENNPATTPRNDPSALGPMAPCTLGTNKMTKLTKFEEWLEEAENRMNYIGNQEDRDKIILLKSWGGSELNEFIKTHVAIRTTAQEAVDGNPAIPADTYDEVVEKIKVELRKLVNRTMAMHDLLNTKQGTRSWMDYIHELEKKAKVLDFARKPYTTEEAIKDAAIRGMADAKLSEKALAEDHDKETLVKQGQAREAGRQDVSSLRNKDSDNSTIKRVHNRDGWLEEMDEGELEDLMQTIVKKINRAGKYSNRYKQQEGRDSDGDVGCSRCLLPHAPSEKCPAQGKDCQKCGKKNHFARACKTRLKDIKRVTTEWTYLETRMLSSEKGTITIGQVTVSGSKDLRVPITIGLTIVTMFIDSGCDITILPPELYKEDMGDIVEEDMNLRSWGADKNLEVVGMIKGAVLKTKRGAKHETKVYIVKGFHAEALLGYEDGEELGFIQINKEGRHPTAQEQKENKPRQNILVQKIEQREGKVKSILTMEDQNKTSMHNTTTNRRDPLSKDTQGMIREDDRNSEKVAEKREKTGNAKMSNKGNQHNSEESIPAKIRKNLELTVHTHPTNEHKIPEEEVKKCLELVSKYRSSVYDERKPAQQRRKHTCKNPKKTRINSPYTPYK